MAFTVEDGTGVAGANSFTTVAYFRDYFTDRGISGTDSTSIPDATLQSLLIRATDYIVKRFGTRFNGSRATDTQSLPFPREGIYIDSVEVDDASVPDALQQATCEYALRANEIVLAPDPPIQFDREDASGNTLSAGGVVQSKTEKVDVIEESVTFGAGPGGDFSRAKTKGGSRLTEAWMIPAYPAADLLLEQFLKSGGSVIR